jgi:hypothetical protein
MNGLMVSARYQRNGGKSSKPTKRVCDECVYFWVIFQINILE